MLFCIDDSILEVLDDEVVIDALANLATARKQGTHLIYAKRNILEVLSKHSEFSSSSKNVYKYVLNRSVKLKGYLSQFNRRVVLVSEENIIQKHIDEKEHIITMSIHFLKDINILTEAIILLENINDYKVYKHIADYLIYIKELTDIKVTFNTMPGSGGDIGKIFKNKIEENKHLILSIADTDRSSPNEGMGATIKPLIKVYNRINQKCIGEVKYDNYHELENLIPYKIYEEFSGITTEMISSYKESAVTSSVEVSNIFPISWKKFMLNIHRKGRYDALMYFDYKDGITLSHLRNINGEKFWCNLLKEFGIELDISKYKPINDYNKKNIIIEGFNDKVVNVTFEKLKEKKFEEYDYLLNDELKVVWNRIGEIILSWGCGTIPIRQI